MINHPDRTAAKDHIGFGVCDDDELSGYLALSLYCRFFPVDIPYPITGVSFIFNL
jgi:hypothetical protein